ncbi:MAG: hypothetical protein ACI8RD_014770 [Bacillariaceae sp.]|jgi:hypothetical protein
MGRKQKSKRNKAAAIATSATATAPAVKDVRQDEDHQKGFEDQDYLFPKSNFYIKAELFEKKGNRYRANKFYLQGIEIGCVRCITDYLVLMFNESRTSSYEIWKDNKKIHLAMPLCLEGAIRGSTGAASVMMACMSSDCLARHNDAPMMYWMKYFEKHTDAMIQDERKSLKACDEKMCAVCGEQDSDTVTLGKCDRCNVYYYCSTDCQSKDWRAGHAGECRQLEILKKYHKPFGEKIRDDIVNGINPMDIPELQELRNRLGLSRPKMEYQDLLDKAQSLRINPSTLIDPRKDGTVQIGSFPGPF